MEDWKKITMMVVGLVLMITWVAWRLAVDRNTPRTKYNEQAEVIGKREKLDAYGNDVPIRHYIIAFKFSDGSIKELRTSYGAESKVYDSIHEGDTGILVYTELVSIEIEYEDETERWKGRNFISFEKDPDSNG